MVTNHFQSVAILLNFHVSVKGPSTVLISDTYHPLDTNGQKTQGTAPISVTKGKETIIQKEIWIQEVELVFFFFLNHSCGKLPQT